MSYECLRAGQQGGGDGVGRLGERRSSTPPDHLLLLLEPLLGPLAGSSVGRATGAAGSSG